MRGIYHALLARRYFNRYWDMMYGCCRDLNALDRTFILFRNHLQMAGRWRWIVFFRN